MIRDYWLYQKRQNESAQWAVYTVKEWTRAHPELTRLDFTIYSEDISNELHSKSFIGWHYPTMKGYADRLIQEMEQFTTITEADRQQIEKHITDVLI